MPTDLTQLEDRLRAAYADAAETVQPDDIRPRAPAATSPVRWHGAARIGATRIGGRRATALAAAAAVVLIIVVATVVPVVLQSGSRHRTGGPGIAGSRMAYVVTQRDLLIPVNLATGTALAPIPLGVKGSDAGVLISPDNRTVYVVSVRGQLVPVDVTTGKAGRPIEVGGVPAGLVMTPGGKAAYVLEPPYGVVAVDLTTRTALGLIKIHDADSFVLTPDGKTLYVLGSVATGPALTAISTATNTISTTIALRSPLHGWFAGPQSLVMAPDGKTVYASMQAINPRTSRQAGVILPVDLANGSERKPIELARSGSPVLTISPDGRWGYLAEATQSTKAQPDGVQQIAPVDLRTRAVLPWIPLPANQNGYELTLSPGGATLYATAIDGSAIVPVDTATGTALQPIRLRSFPRWYQYQGVFAPGGRTLYVLSYDDYPKGALIAGRMTPVNTATGGVGKSIEFPEGLNDIVFGR